MKKPTEESARERDLGVEVGRDSRYGSIYVCPPSPSRGPAPRCSSLSSSPLPSVPWIPHPQLVPLGAGVGRRVCRVHRAQVARLGGLFGDVLEVGWWWAGVARALRARRRATRGGDSPCELLDNHSSPDHLITGACPPSV